MYIKVLNRKLTEHQFFVHIEARKARGTNPGRFRLLKVERDANKRLLITVEWDASKNLTQFRLINEQKHRERLDKPVWVLVYKDPMTGNLVQAAKPQQYVVNGLIIVHLDD